MVWRVVVMVVVAAGLVVGLVWSQHRKAAEKVSGFLEVHDVRVGSRVGGRIAKVLVVEGQEVRKGDMMVELEAYDLGAKLAEAQGKLREAEETLRKLEAGFRKEEIAQARAKRDQLKAAYEKAVAGPRAQEIKEAEALVDQATVQRRLAAASYERVSKAFEQKVTSMEERDRSENEFKAASETLNVRRQQLDLLKEGTRKEDIAQVKGQLEEAEAALALMENGSREEDKAAARAAVESAKGSVEVIQKQVEELKIAAPVDGVVDAVDIRPGDLLGANAPALAVLDKGEMWVRAYVPENRLSLTTGQKVKVTVDSFPGREFHGVVTFVSRQAEPTPSNVQTVEERSKQVFRIRVTMEDGKGELRAGMAADVWLSTK